MYHPKNKHINILVVEDNDLDVLIIQTLLQPHFNIEIVSNGNDALSIIEDVNFDIILMDINLGDENMNGITVMKHIKNNPNYQHIKICAVTAYSENDVSYVEQGFDRLFIKPVIKEDIFEFIKNNV